MKTRVKKWGNSLGLRIPKLFATESHIENNTIVEMFVSEGKIIISPIKKPAIQLNDLLSKINKKNIHHEIKTGPATGQEIW
ncbi:MAG: AbrB/MazE/SpoVT family DNA-binding domain-containing protein [Elusimicrobiota bacterium]